MTEQKKNEIRRLEKLHGVKVGERIRLRIQSTLRDAGKLTGRRDAGKLTGRRDVGKLHRTRFQKLSGRENPHPEGRQVRAGRA